MHQTSTGTNKKQKNKNSSNYSEVDFGDSDFTKHWRNINRHKKNKTLDAPTGTKRNQKKNSNYSEVDP